MSLNEMKAAIELKKMIGLAIGFAVKVCFVLSIFGGYWLLKKTLGEVKR